MTTNTAADQTTTAPGRVTGVRNEMPPGASYVATPSFTLAQTAARIASEKLDMAGFFGDAGTGKTTAIEYFMDHTDFECIYLVAEPSPQRKEIFEEILLKTTGGFDATMSARQLRRACNEVLAERRRVLVMDECQHLSILWHRQLRTLHTHAEAQFALFLAGGENAVSTLKRDQMLWTRIKEKVYFQALTGDVLLASLAQFHPLLANTDPELLADIDAAHCDGNFREWANFVDLAIPLAANSRTPERLSLKVVQAVFALEGVNWKKRR